LERERDIALKAWEYKLLATNKTSTMQKELQEAAASGFEFVGVTVAPGAGVEADKVAGERFHAGCAVSCGRGRKRLKARVRAAAVVRMRLA